MGEAPEDPPKEPPTPRRSRSLPGGLTSNALVSGVVAAVVSGVISFGVARYQTQDANREALAGQQATAVVQLETSSSAFWEDTNSAYTYLSCNSRHDKSPACQEEASSVTIFFSVATAFNAARLNVSDAKASALAAQMATLGHNTIFTPVHVSAAQALINMTAVYKELITRCGQIIQGQG
jgi:hypothetical protein